MGTTISIARRELGAFFKTPTGYFIAAAVLLIDGLLYNGYALGNAPKLSSQVLEDFFFYATGTTMIAAVVLSMRLIAEERQSGTLTLLFTSAVRERQIIAGKFTAALLFLSFITLLSAYLPALIFIRGKVSIGHIAAGYVGLLLLGAASLALGTLGSTIGRSQLMAAILGSVFVVMLLINWKVAQVADPPLREVIGYTALFDKHFPPFQRGIVSLRDVVYYVSVVYLALLASTRILQTQRSQ